MEQKFEMRRNRHRHSTEMETVVLLVLGLQFCTASNSPLIISSGELEQLSCEERRALILTDNLGCNASLIPDGYLMCDLPYTSEERRDSSVEVSIQYTGRPIWLG